MTNEQLIEAWDNNLPITTCNMGGMDDDYEHVIHVLAMEMLRSMLKHPAPQPLPDTTGMTTEIIERKKEWSDYRDLIEDTPNVKWTIEQTGCTGAQFGAAMNIASVFLINGYDKGCGMIPKDRLIQIQKEPNVKV